MADPMRYVLKQKLLSWGDDYYIRDSNDHDVYFVDGKAFSLDSSSSDFSHGARRMRSLAPERSSPS